MEGSQYPPTPNEAHQRIQKHVDTLFQALENYEEDHPHWQNESLLWIMGWCLQELRAILEEGRDSNITWENPFVEVHFPVDCTWQETNGEKTFSLNAGNITSENTADKDTAIKTLSEIMVRQIEIATLQSLTNHVALEKRDNGFVPVLDVEVGNHLLSIADDNERKRLLDELLRPISFGAGRIELARVEEDEPIPASVIEEFERDWQHVNPPLVSIPLNVHGLNIVLVAILEIQPLVADPIKQEAYFPLTVGLGIQSPQDRVSEAWLDLPQTALHRWSDDDRKRIWDIISDWLKQLITHLHNLPIPKIEEAVVTVNATMRVAVDRNDPNGELKILEAIRGEIGGVGEVTSFIAQLGPPSILDTHALQSMLEKVEQSHSADEKGKSLEQLVAALFSTVEGFRVLDDRIRTETEEIDLCIENSSERVPFRNEEDLILVECKNWTGKCGKNDFVSFRQKMENRNSRASLGFLLSWNGFAETVTKEMLRGSRDRLLVALLTGAEVREAVAGKSFFDILSKARLTAISF